jgi:hypothetical protein
MIELFFVLKPLQGFFAGLALRELKASYGPMDGLRENISRRLGPWGLVREDSGKKAWRFWKERLWMGALWSFFGFRRGDCLRHAAELFFADFCL